MTSTMAEPIASGLLTLAIFASQSSTSLAKTVQSFTVDSKSVRDLKEELKALSEVLRALIGTVDATTDVDFSALNRPLLQCDKACKEFEQEIIKCLSRSGGNRTSFRDWAKLSFMEDNIDGFRQRLAGYKATFSIALADATIRKSSVTAKIIDEFKNHIKDRIDDLETHLQRPDEKLETLRPINEKQVSLHNEVMSFPNSPRASPYSVNRFKHHSSVNRVRYDSHGYHLEGGLVDRGSFGIVAKVTHENNSNSFFARKQIPKWRINERDLRNEVQLIRAAKHQHVIKIVEDYEDDENFYIVMAPFATCTLSRELKRMTSNRSQCLKWEEFGEKRVHLSRFMRCLAATVRDLHSRGIRHRDIKPDNILIENQAVIVTDFGTSFESRDVTRAGLTKTWGTEKYEPPEAFDTQNGRISKESKKRTGRLGDIFMLGCVFYEILEALSIQANFPHTNDKYAIHIVNKTFVNMVRVVKERSLLVSRRLAEGQRLLGLVEKMLELVMNHMMVIVEERKDAIFVLEAINRIYQDYDELRSGCCGNET